MKLWIFKNGINVTEATFFSYKICHFVACDVLKNVCSVNTPSYRKKLFR